MISRGCMSMEDVDTWGDASCKETKVNGTVQETCLCKFFDYCNAGPSVHKLSILASLFAISFSSQYVTCPYM